MVERAWVIPPQSRLGTVTDAERQGVIRSSALFGRYEAEVDRESAYEKLKARAEAAASAPEAQEAQEKPRKAETGARAAPARTRSRQGSLETMAKSAARSIGSQLGREIMRGLLGAISGGKRRR